MLPTVISREIEVGIKSFLGTTFPCSTPSSNRSAGPGESNRDAHVAPAAILWPDKNAQEDANRGANFIPPRLDAACGRLDNEVRVGLFFACFRLFAAMNHQRK